MVAPCAELLSCAESQKDYRYPFNGGYVAPTMISYDPPTIQSGYYSPQQQIQMGYYPEVNTTSSGGSTFDTYESSPTSPTRDTSNYVAAEGY